MVVSKSIADSFMILSWYLDHTQRRILAHSMRAHMKIHDMLILKRSSASQQPQMMSSHCELAVSPLWVCNSPCELAVSYLWDQLMSSPCSVSSELTVISRWDNPVSALYGISSHLRWVCFTKFLGVIGAITIFFFIIIEIQENIHVSNEGLFK